jgi:hypothetical protein
MPRWSSRRAAAAASARQAASCCVSSADASRSASASRAESCAVSASPARATCGIKLTYEETASALCFLVCPSLPLNQTYSNGIIHHSFSMIATYGGRLVNIPTSLQLKKISEMCAGPPL